jgi:hypothetical protein
MIFNYNTRQFPIEDKNFAIGDSHTWGWGVEEHEAWPALLNLINLGIRGSSADQLVRMSEEIIPHYKPNKIYVLWPNWRRFELKEQNGFRQILPTTKDRINLMEKYDENWCLQNFKNQVQKMKDICAKYNVSLTHMSFYDLHPYIDYPDRWPLNKTKTHYAPLWHTWVAKIISLDKEFPIADE